MVRILHLYVPVSVLVLAAVDVLVLFGAISFGLALSYAGLGSVLRPDPQILEQKLVFVGAAMLGMFAMGLYHRRYLLGVWALILRIALAMVLAFLILTALFYVVPDLRIWISALGMGLIIGFVGLMATRWAFRQVADLGTFKRRLLVLGNGPRAAQLELLERSMTPSRFTCVGFVPLGGEGAVDRTRLVPAENIAQLCRALRIDDIVLALEERRGRLPVRDLLDCRLRGIRVLDQSTFLERELGTVEIDSLYPSWLIFADGGFTSRLRQWLKRAFDVVISLAVLLFTLPLLILTVMAIYLEDGGPIFYRQERVGLFGRPFTLLKFRSMRADAEGDGVARWAQLGDDRVTRVGRIIRKLRIDEIPQIYNVLSGEMSFVGPRPERPTIVADLTTEVPFYEYRHVVKPGITGWAQINYPYGASVRDAREKLKHDLYYIKNYSLLLDLLILLQTLRVVLIPAGAR